MFITEDGDEQHVKEFSTAMIEREAALTKQLEVALSALTTLSNAVDQNHIQLDSGAILSLMEARNAIEQIKESKV